MIDNVGFSMDGSEHYFYWQNEDKRTLKKINKLIDDIIHNGNTGIGQSRTAKTRFNRQVES